VEATLEAESRQAPGHGVLVLHLRGGARMEIGDGLSAALARSCCGTLRQWRETKPC
jgi:hypothetical protein